MPTSYHDQTIASMVTSMYVDKLSYQYLTDELGEKLSQKNNAHNGKRYPVKLIDNRQLFFLIYVFL